MELRAKRAYIVQRNTKDVSQKHNLIRS